jgi:hypothetical protein
MISTLSIALNGLRIGADTLEIGVQGFLVQPEPTPIIEPTGGFFLVPVWPRHEPVKRQNRKKNRDISVMVEGCTLRTSVDQVDAGEVVEGCEATFSVGSPRISISSSFEVVGCAEENELEVFLMALHCYRQLTGESFFA